MTGVLLFEECIRIIKIMKRNKIICSTTARESLNDITKQIEEAVEKETGIGMLHLFLPHTTAGLVISDKMETVSHDVNLLFSELFPVTHQGYKHRSANSDAHIKSVVCGNQLTIPVEDGRLLLGDWQHVFIIEGDGPKNNRAIICTYVS